jgi:aryl-alcohol dehydrogenase-like predicted oxidoreductase
MRTRKLGKSDEQISAIGLGCMGIIGWYGERDDIEARATLARALDLGLNHFDTAEVYNGGENEKFLAGSIKGRRQDVFLATKCGNYRGADGPYVDNKPATIEKAIDGSLQRLGTDYIDLYYLHRIDRNVPIEESVGAMAELVAAGKIRHVGISEVGEETIRRANATHPIAAVQNEYSLWTREYEGEVLDACRELDISFVAYSPLGRGFLTGAISKEKPIAETDSRNRHPRFQGEALDHNLLIVDKVTQIAKEKGCTPAQLALAWAMAQGDNVMPIPGTKRRSYLEENIAACEITFSAAELAEIDKAFPDGETEGDRYPSAMMPALRA